MCLFLFFLPAFFFFPQSFLSLFYCSLHRKCLDCILSLFCVDFLRCFITFLFFCQASCFGVSCNFSLRKIFGRNLPQNGAIFSFQSCLVYYYWPVLIFTLAVGHGCNFFFFFFFLDLHGWEFAAPVSCAGYNSNKWHTETSVHTENIKIFLRAHLTFFLFWTSCCPLLFCNVQTVLTASSVISPMRTPFFFFYCRVQQAMLTWCRACGICAANASRELYKEVAHLPCRFSPIHPCVAV